MKNKILNLRNIFYTILFFMIMSCFSSCSTHFGKIVELPLSYILCHSIIGGIALIIELVAIIYFSDEFDAPVTSVWTGIVCLFLFIIPYIYLPISMNKYYWLKSLLSSIIFVISTNIVLYLQYYSYSEKNGGYSVLYVFIVFIVLVGLLFPVRPYFWIFSNLSVVYTLLMSLIFGRAISERGNFIKKYLYQSYDTTCSKWVGFYGFVFAITSFVPLYLQISLVLYFKIQVVGFFIGLLIWSIYFGVSKSANEKAIAFLLMEDKKRKEKEQEEKRQEQERKAKAKQERLRKKQEDEELAKKQEEERLRNEKEQEELIKKKEEQSMQQKKEHARKISEQTGIILD